MRVKTKDVRFVSSYLIICMLSAIIAPYVARTADAEQQKQLGDLTGPWILMVDDYAIASKKNVVRRYHTFQKYAKNPVMTADKPWEGGVAYIYGTVLPGKDGRGYRMWYHTYNPRARFGGKRGYANCYATSEDGLSWKKPELGIFSYKGSKKNNMFMNRKRSPGDDHMPQVIHTPWDKDPARQYKMLTFAYYDGYWASYSPDGVHWKDVKKNPVLVDPGDVGNFVWNPVTKRYLGYPKIWVKNVRGSKRRCIGMTSTKDFESWPKSKLILVPDKKDDRWVKKKGDHTDFYGMSGFPYESMYIGFLWVYRLAANDFRIHLELVTSHDGEHWQRIEGDRKAILALGSAGSWDSGMLFSGNHPLVEGDKIKMFYGGFSKPHNVSARTAGVGLATLRKDGFASLDAGKSLAVITTHPLNNVGEKLQINAAASKGSIRVEVLGSDGKVLPGYSREACQPITKDHVKQTVTWKTKSKLPKGDRKIVLRFVMQNASLYSFNAGKKARVAPAR